MKKLLLITFITLFFCVAGIAQNLVGNPSFEDTLHCPDNIGQINYAKGWQSCSEGDPEYFNSCSVVGAGIPQNGWGYQNTPDPNCSGYCGFYSYNPWSPNNREFIGTHLINALTVGVKYYCSMKVSLSDFSDCASNNLGFLFSTMPLYFGLSGPLNNFAQVYNPNIISDKIAWTKIFGGFVADSAYNFIVISNFFDDAHTDTSCNGVTSLLPYYFIDDICVSNDSSYTYNYSFICGDGLIDYKKSSLKIYPNPASDEITIDIPEAYQNCKVIFYNLLGKKIKESVIQPISNKIEIINFYQGVYFIQIYYNNKTIIRKLIID